MSTPSSNAPDPAVQQALAGAFIAIKVANKAISLQPNMPTVTIKGLENVNASLATAQGHATYWRDTLSQNVQNQLQHILDYNALYAPLASTINSSIVAIKAGTSQAPPTEAMQTLLSCFQAVQQQVQQILYGTGGDQNNPKPESALGTYNALTAYQTDVGTDKTTFDGYASLAFNSKSGISVQITQLNSDIQSDNEAISKDQSMIAGGATMIVTGVLICCVAVALAPETGGTTIAAIGVLGVATVAGGAVMIGVAAHNLDSMQKDVAAKTTEIANDNTELANLTAINHTSTQVSLQANNIFGALDTILTNWQQLDNDLNNVVTALNLPEADLMKWIQAQAPGQTPTYAVMGIILSALFGTADTDWNNASTTAQTILNALASMIEFTLPPGSNVSMESIAAASKQQ